jgi:hypothetical protein
MVPEVIESMEGELLSEFEEVVGDIDDPTRLSTTV